MVLDDGWQDYIVVSGHVYPQLETAAVGASAPYRQRKSFYRNLRDGTFEEIGEQMGSAFTERCVNRGLAIGDLDNDGRLDVVRTRLIRSGSSYISQEDMRLHFGLGEHSQVDRLEVRWPDGSTTERDNVSANQILVVEQK